jgi:hypothetical protein
MFQTKVVGKIKTRFMFSNFFPKNVPFMGNVEIYGTARQDTNDDMWHKLFACWIT